MIARRLADTPMPDPAPAALRPDVRSALDRYREAMAAEHEAERALRRARSHRGTSYQHLIRALCPATTQREEQR